MKAFTLGAILAVIALAQLPGGLMFPGPGMVSSPPANPAPVYIGGAVTNIQAGTLSYTVTAAHNLLVVLCHSANAASTSLTDSNTNTWTNIANNQFSAGGPDWMLAWDAPDSKAGATVITCSGGVTLQIIVMEFSGAPTSSPLDGSVGIGTTSASVTTTLTNDLLVFGAFGVGGTGNNASCASTILCGPGQTGAYTLRQSGSGSYGSTPRGSSGFSQAATSPGSYSNGVTGSGPIGVGTSYQDQGAMLIPIKAL